jgi:hypothetical protein
MSKRNLIVLIVLIIGAVTVSAGAISYFFKVETSVTVDSLLYVNNQPVEGITHTWVISGCGGDKFNRTYNISINNIAQTDHHKFNFYVNKSDVLINAYWNVTGNSTPVTEYNITKTPIKFQLNVELPINLTAGNYTVNWEIKP